MLRELVLSWLMKVCSLSARKLEQAISVAGARDHAREGSLYGLAGRTAGLAGLGFLTLEKRGTDRVFPEKSAPVYKTDPFLTFPASSTGSKKLA
jgi:hypothetical protein